MRESRIVRPRTLTIVLGCLLVAVHYAIFGAFFPARNGNVGSDYAYFLTQLLDGFIWYQKNGLFAVPWHTPSFCGGVPKFPNPQSLYYSVPQAFTLVAGPLQAVKLTLLTFSSLGFLGAYLLLRRTFAVRVEVAILGGTLFLFNGLYAHRMLIGHLTFHSFMLLPLLLLFLLRADPAEASEPRWRRARDVVLAAGCLAYMAMTGVAHVLLQSVTAALLVACIAAALGLRTVSMPRFVANLVCAGAIALALSAAKLSAMAALLGEFPRRLYPLPGVAGVGDLLSLFANSLFWVPVESLTTEAIANSRWQLARPEFEFGVSFVPALLVIAFLAIALVSAARRGGLLPASRRQGNYAFAALVLLALPAALNFYAPAWNAFLKELPVLGSSVSLLRWIAVYIPAAIVLACVAADRIASRVGFSKSICAVSILAVVAWNASVDRAHYHEQPYDPRPVEAAYAKIRSGPVIPSITRLAVPVDARGNPWLSQERNDSMLTGASQIHCYETLFGFRQEVFPGRSLQPGPALIQIGDGLNLMNPACLVFPEANHCKPGDRFRPADIDRARAFLRYEPFAFDQPTHQRVANWISAAAWLAFALFWIAYAVGAGAEAVGRRRLRRE